MLKNKQPYKSTSFTEHQITPNTIDNMPRVFEEPVVPEAKQHVTSSNTVYLNSHERQFINSHVSTQDTLISQNTQFTTNTIVSAANTLPSMDEPFSQKPGSHLKVAHRYSQSDATFFTASQLSLHSCSRTTSKTVPKKDVILINNMPYPTKLVFPAKISNNKINPSKPVQTTPPQIQIEPYNYKIDSGESYDTLLQVIDSYTY